MTLIQELRELSKIEGCKKKVEEQLKEAAKFGSTYCEINLDCVTTDRKQHVILIEWLKLEGLTVSKYDKKIESSFRQFDDEPNYNIYISVGW